MNPVIYTPQSKRLLEQLCEVLRYKHYSLETEQAYAYWVKFFVRWCGRSGQMRRIPSVLTKAEVTALLGQMDGEVSLRHALMS